MGERSKILVTGGTGYIGKFISKRSAELGHPTFILVRDKTASDPDKLALLETFKSLQITLLYGDNYDQNSLLEAIKKVDVVISAVGFDQIADQANIISAIKQCGNVKRFFPSEFGTDTDRVHPIEPAGKSFRDKSSIRRALEAEGISYTIALSNSFAGCFLPNLGQFKPKLSSKDKVVIIGNGNLKEMFVDEEDIASYTIKALDDVRTLNKCLKIQNLSWSL